VPAVTTEAVVDARWLGPSSRPRRSKPSIDTTTKFNGVQQAKTDCSTNAWAFWGPLARRLGITAN